MEALLLALLLGSIDPLSDRLLEEAFPYGLLLYERGEANEIQAHIMGACTEEPGCDARMARDLVSALKSVRAISAATSSTVADAVRADCRRSANYSGALDADHYMKCLIRAKTLPQSRLLSLAGLQRFGVTMRGFYALRTGMSEDDVRLILGEYGEMSAHSSAGGEVFSVYTWRARNGGILTATFHNWELRSKAQSSLP